MPAIVAIDKIANPPRFQERLVEFSILAVQIDRTMLGQGDVGHGRQVRIVTNPESSYRWGDRRWYWWRPSSPVQIVGNRQGKQLWPGHIRGTHVQVPRSLSFRDGRRTLTTYDHPLTDNECRRGHPAEYRASID